MEFIIIGKIINTQGIKGEVKIQPLTSDLGRFAKLGTVYLGENKEKVTYEKSRIQKNFIILKLEEYNNINEVLKFKDQYIYISAEDKVKLKPGEYFITDLLDSKVYNMDHEEIGVVVDVYEGLSNDNYVIKNINGEFMVPAVKEFIKIVDVENKKIYIDPIEGMVL